MKNQIHLAVAYLLCGAALAGVPVRWTAETSRVQPIALDAWRGDTLALECTLRSYGQPVTLGAATASLMWQTNGMGSAWWQTNATVSADGVIRATWSPSMDPGAPAVAFFLPVQTGDGASYRAAGTLRFRPSPGAGSQIAQLPQPGGTLDFGEFNLVNAPWATLAAANDAISAAVTSATGALVIPPPVDLGPYATTGYVAGAITSATGALVIPPPVDLGPYATTGAVAQAVQTSSNALAGQIQAVSNAAMPRAEMGAYATQADVSTAIAGIQIPSLAGYATHSYVAAYFATNYTPPDLSSYASRSYADAAASNAQAAAIAAIPSLAGYATQSYVADYFATNYTPPDLSSYASRSYADAAASNAQAAAIASIPSLAGYATQSYVADYFATNYTPPDLSSYASRSYADAAASNAQAAAIAAIPSLAGYATETYAQNAASAAASDALSAAQSYARGLSWGASEGNTRLVSLDGTIWQDATGTVWQVSTIYGWQGTVLNLPNTISEAIKFYPVSNGVWTAGGSTNVCWDGMSWSLELTNTITYADGSPTQSATNLIFTTSFDQYYLYYLPVALATNPVDRVLYASDAGDAATADRALSIGTPTRWADATGCVWQVDFGFQQVIFIHGIPYELSYSPHPNQILWYDSEFGDRVYYDTLNHGWRYVNTNGSWTNKQEIVLGQQTITLYDEYEIAEPISFDLTYYSPTTNLVGRVALTNDLPGAISSTISDFAATGTVHAAESSTYSSRLFDASHDSAYDATYLIRESTNAATAVASSLVRYALVTPGEWEFGGVPSGLTVAVFEYDGSGNWYLSLSDGDYGIVSETDENLLSAKIITENGLLITATRASLPGHLLDRAVNAMSISSITTITLPALSHPGQARDFILLLDIPSSVTNTVPGLTGLLTFTPSSSETVHFYVDGDDPSTAEFPVPTSPGTWSYSFSEFKTSWFAISIKPIVEVVPPSQSNGGAQ